MTDLLLQIGLGNACFALACVCFWWNPVVWWARRNLRANEELCCDALVVSSLRPKPRTYANSLLSAVEFLACPAVRPPAMASEINSGGFLVRRFKMIVSVSENPNRMSSRWLRACVLLCAMLVLPLGVAVAQDFKAVERRLGEGVAKGELTLKQADLMMGALKKATAEGKGRHDEKRRKEGPGMEARLHAVGARLKAAVKRGEMSEKEARAKWAAINKGAPERGQSDRARVDAHLRETWGKLQAAVKAGKMSQEDALKKIGAIKREVFAKLKGAGDREHGKVDRAREYLMKVRKDLGAAVEAGKISKEDAAKKHQAAEKAVRERMAAGRGRTRARQDQHQKPDRAHHEHLMRVRRDLGEALKAGKISKEDAAKKYHAAEKAIKARMAAGRGERDAKRGTQDALSRAGIEIRKAVAAGKITKEQGRAKMEAIRKKMGRQGGRGAERGATRRPTPVDWDSIKRRIEGAVKRGDITRKEADAKYSEIKERMGRQGER